MRIKYTTTIKTSIFVFFLSRCCDWCVWFSEIQFQLQLQVHHEKFFCTEYEKSKVVADKVAKQAASEGVPIVLLYPGVIYGPGKLTAGNVLARMVLTLILHSSVLFHHMTECVWMSVCNIDFEKLI